MFKLSDIQTRFQDYLLNDNAAPTPSSHSFHNHVKGHLEAYFEAYRLRLVEVLTMDFPNCEKLINQLKIGIKPGESPFENTALHYLQRHPSTHFSVRYFGQFFSSFLANTDPYNQFSYLSELADFEWSMLYSVDAKDADPLSIEALRNVPPEEWAHLLFQIHPSVQYKKYEWDIAALWKSLSSDESANLQKQPIACLFWRKGIRNFFETLPLAHQVFYQGMAAGKSFGALCEDLFDITPEDQSNTVPATAVGILQYWIEQQVITALI